jgi:hypothetical protein
MIKCMERRQRAMSPGALRTHQVSICSSAESVLWYDIHGCYKADAPLPLTEY